MARFEIPEGWVAQAYRFALDPCPAQVSMLESHCGAARFAFNHMSAVVKTSFGQRTAERSYGIADEDLTPAQGWSLPKLRKTWNARKNEGTVVGGQRQGGPQLGFGRVGPRVGELVDVAQWEARRRGEGVSDVQIQTPLESVGAVHHRRDSRRIGSPSRGVTEDRAGPHA
jgi:hypothetical protein